MLLISLLSFSLFCSVFLFSLLFTLLFCVSFLSHSLICSIFLFYFSLLSFSLFCSVFLFSPILSSALYIFFSLPLSFPLRSSLLLSIFVFFITADRHYLCLSATHCSHLLAVSAPHLVRTARTLHLSITYISSLYLLQCMSTPFIF